MTEDELLEKLSTLLVNLSFDYDRLSESGKSVYDDILHALAKLKGD